MKSSKTLPEYMNAEDAETYISSFLIHLRAENKRNQTLDHYLGAVRQFVRFAEVEHFPEIPSIRTTHVSIWLASLRTTITRNGRPYAEASIRNRYLGLRVFYDWLAREGDIARSPFGGVNARLIRPPEADEQPKDVVTPEDMAVVLRRLETEKRWRDAAVIALLYDTGMRASELASLRSESVNLVTGVIQLGAAGSPTKARKPRMVRLSPKGVQILDRYWRRVKRKAPEFVINGTAGGHEARFEMTRTGIYGIVRRSFNEAGVKGTIGAHDLRHTSASHVAEGGLISESDAMALYGWRSPEMWRRYTEQARERSALNAHVRASPLERLPKR